MELSKETLQREVTQFRSKLDEKLVDAAEHAVRLEKRGKVGVLVFDAQNEKVNKLSTPVMLRIFELLVQVDDDRDIGALVLVSRKPTIFIAGADINEIQSLTSGGAEGMAASEALMKLQSVFTYLESLPIPSVAAIHGAALGGGLELSLACDYRMATDAKETKIGLPEVLLGVIPGWGGTQRLPRLIGLEKSLDMILTGRQVDGRKAFKLGLVDQLVPKEILEEKAVKWANDLAQTGKKREFQKDIKGRLLETVPGGKWVILDQAKKQVLKKTKGNYPAPLKAISVIRNTYGTTDIHEGLKIEAQGFAELVTSPECKNLIQLFFLNESVKRDKGTDSGIKGKPVKMAGVLGAGVMGGGIAQLFAAKNVRVRMKDINWEAISKGYQTAFALFNKMRKRKKLTPSEFDNAMARIEGTTNFEGLKNADLVVEAIVEDMSIKKKVLADLDKKVGPQTIIASNTSSLSISEMGEAVSDPSRMVGMHFFNPVHKMPLIEIIRSDKTSDETVATIFQFSKKLGKTPVVVKDGPGFVVNRILAPYLNEAIYLVYDGVAVEDLDELMEKFGMPMGPCTLLDEVGLDVGMKVSKILYGAFGDRMVPPEGLNSFVESGRLGKKTNKGIYEYDSKGKRTCVYKEGLKKLAIKPRESHLTDEVVERRLTYLMINEAARILEEKLVRRPSDIDVAMIFGTGFAPFRGGLLRFADTIGAEAIVSDLDLFSRSYGPRFQPADFLQQLAVNNKKFYE